MSSVRYAINSEASTMYINQIYTQICEHLQRTNKVAEKENNILLLVDQPKECSLHLSIM